MPELHQILLVEDEPDIQIIARLSLERLGGFNLEICNSGSEALVRLETLRPDLILLDVMMPGMDGPTTLLAMRKKFPDLNLPIIFMTAKVQPAELTEYKAMGVLDVIAKPFDPMTLADTIRQIWSQSHV